MNTKTLSELFGMRHDHLLRSVDLCVKKYEISEHSIEEVSYPSSQNKKTRSLNLTSDVVAFLLSSKPTFTNTDKKRVVASEILNELGYETKIVLGNRTRSEEVFHGDLIKFMAGSKIIRQYPIAGFLIDFYLPEFDIFIEYDDSYHFTPEQKAKDAGRLETIGNAFAMVNEGDKPNLVRILEGREMEGLRKLVSMMYLSHNNSALEIEGCNEYEVQCTDEHREKLLNKLFK